MPPDPWKLLKTAELTPQQAIQLKQKLEQRQSKLKDALDKLEAALKLVSEALDQGGASRYVRKIKRGPARTTGRKTKRKAGRRG
jgi:hypothetical protein